MLSPGESFKFACHKGLSCFNSCCRDVNIFLAPYDVLRMKQRLGITSDEFLKRYTVIIQGEEGLPYVLIKMRNDQMKTCPFVQDNGCSIYEDRPWSCRMYPIFPDVTVGEVYMLEEKPACLGLQEKTEWTVEQWKRAQGIEVYDRMNDAFSVITNNEFFKTNKLELDSARQMILACYNIDQFKKYIFETRFLEIYEIEEDILKNIREDEEELLNFGYQWIRFRIFAEDIIKVKDKDMETIFHITGI